MIYVFNDCELDTDRYELRKSGQSLQLEPKVFDVLVYLIQHRQRVVTKDELLSTLWPNQFVSETTLNHAIMAARRATGDNGRLQSIIQTFRSRGYRFIAAVEERSEMPTDGVPAPSRQTPQASWGEALTTRLGHASASTTMAEPPRPEAVPSLQVKSDGERKPVTVLSCALANAAELMHHVGPDIVHYLMQQFFALAETAVRQYGGTITHFWDDGLRALFGAPVAHEDHARRAVLAALELQRYVATRLDDAAALVETELAVRMGLNTGLVLVSSVGEDLRLTSTAIAGTTDLAVRCQQHAPSGAILVSTATGRLIRDTVRLERYGPIPGVGPEERPYVYLVVSRRRRRAVPRHWGESTLSAFVGRQRELATLQALLTQVEEGEGQVVGIVGESGMGKSRLLLEFYQHLVKNRAVYIEGHCLSYGNTTPYLPILDILRQAWSIAEGDAHETIIARVREGLQQAPVSVIEALPYFLHLLGLPRGQERLRHLTPEAIKAQTFAWLRELGFAISQQKPLVLVVEDLHWIDATSAEFLSSLVEHLAGTSILLLTTYRPGYNPVWMDKSYATQIALPRLTSHDSLEVVKSILGRASGMDLPAQEIIAKAAGNPFFLEELTQSVREQDTVPSTLTIPDTIQAVLAARIDRLPPTEKRLLQTAAVIGKDVPFSLLVAIVETSEEALDDRLMTLQTAEFLHEKRDTTERMYTFKHVLTQEVAYQSLLTGTRRQLHQRIVQVLQTQLPETVARQPELLAHHASEAGLVPQAIEAWRRAGQHAMGRSAYIEATAHLRRGLNLLGAMPNAAEQAQYELPLQITLGQIYMATKGYAAPEVEHAYARAHTLCEQVGNIQRRFAVLWGLWGLHFIRADHRWLRELGPQCLELAQQMNQPALLLRAHFAQGMGLFNLGEFAAAQRHLEQGLALYDPAQRRSHSDVQDPGVGCLSYLALTWWAQGYADRAVTTFDQALSLAEQLSHPSSRVVAMVLACACYQYRGEPQRVAAMATTATQLATAQGFPFFTAAGTMFQGWAQTESGQAEAGIALMRQALASFRATGAELYRPYLLALLAEGYRHARQIDIGLEVVREAQILVEHTGDRWMEAELYRIDGELLLRQPTPDEAQAAACFNQSLAIARRQGAKALELRTAVSLGRLWHRQGMKEPMRQLLAPLCRGFTEGHDTADLRAAHALLEP